MNETKDIREEIHGIPQGFSDRSEEAHARELAEAHAATERAAQAERDRIEAQRQAEEEARAKREADKAHRERIYEDIYDTITVYCANTEIAGVVTDAIMEGKIPHVRVIL